MAISGFKPRSDSAIVRNMLGDIEDALEAGASREDIYETLKKENGLTISFEGFKKALSRARAKTAREAESGLHNPQKGAGAPPADKSAEPEGGKAQENGEVKKPGIMKGGDFAPKKDFDPKKYETKY